MVTIIRFIIFFVLFISGYFLGLFIQNLKDRQNEVAAYRKGIKEGRFESWELARYICSDDGMSGTEIRDVFGSISWNVIFGLTCDEAEEKIRERKK